MYITISYLLIINKTKKIIIKNNKDKYYVYIEINYLALL